jgi:hypothetical protein
MVTAKFSISQSLIKAYNDYLNYDLCGIVFEKQYITNEIESLPSDAMRLGIWFEYECTGALPRSGVIPEPERTVKGALTAEYQRAANQVQNFKEYQKKLGIKILEVATLKKKDGATGLIDIIAEFNGRPVIIDLKYSGVINDKWNPLGWELEALPYKPKLMIQAVHYHYLTGLPFYFWVFSSKDEDSKLIEVVIDNDVLVHHKAMIDKTRSMIELDIEMGFKAYPELTRCKQCPLFENCTEKTEVPLVQTIYYTNQ